MGHWRTLSALILDVRFSPESGNAGVNIVIRDVCFAESGRVHSQNECPLSAISGLSRRLHNVARVPTSLEMED
jgi:hypothetical protein